MSRLEKALEEALRVKRQSMAVGEDSVCLTSGESGDSLAELLPPEGGEEPVFGFRTSETVSASFKSPYIVTEPGDNPSVAEEFGKIKSKIIRIAAENPSANRMLVSSSLKNEGKTLVSINLAFAIARSYDHNVLLVDADLRNPSVHKYLGIEAGPGLVQCLRENIPLSEAVVNTGMQNLGVLTAGDTVRDPVELLSSEKTRRWFEKLRKQNDEMFLIIDTPPVLPFADVHALLPSVGGVVYVIREGWASREQLEESLGSLGNFNLLGLIYNGARLSRHKENYYGDYYGHKG